MRTRTWRRDTKQQFATGSTNHVEDADAAPPPGGGRKPRHDLTTNGSKSLGASAGLTRRWLTGCILNRICIELNLATAFVMGFLTAESNPRTVEQSRSWFRRVCSIVVRE